ncbi:MAG: hypothetical protein GX827_01320 [Clostridiales bacterium]|jgi:ABC-type glycerol-3-phosphate transport system substrate-binding protein|nr:hypothetical protein [Clostridiales bacterium]
MKTKRIFCMLTAALMLVSAVASCGSEGGATAVTTNESATTAAPETTETSLFMNDDLPELDFESAEVKVFCWESWDQAEFFVEEDTGEILDSVIYDRNLKVEERLNIDLVWVMKPRDSAAYGSALKDAMSAQNLSGDVIYDLVACYGARVASCAVDGHLSNLNDAPYMDLSKPWYSESAIAAGQLGDGFNYFFAGDISYNYLSRMSGIFFNRGMINNFGLEDPYKLVLDGKWTIDKLLEMINGTYVDLNGNGKADKEDQFGIMTASDQMNTLYYGTGSHFISHDENGVPRLSDDIFSERTMMIIEKYLGVFADPAAFKHPTVDDTAIFDTGRCLFYIYPLGHVNDATLRDSETTYGFIPQPKPAETEENYHASVTNAVTLFGIPLVVESMERASALAECLSSEGYRLVSPAVFEIVYKVKYNYSEGSEQSEIFDMMRRNVVFDFGKLFMDSFSGFTNGVISETLWSGKNKYASVVASKRESWENTLQKIIENLTAVKN